MRKLQQKPNSLLGWSLLTPAIIVLIVVIFIPLLYSFWLSLHNWDLGRPDLGKVFIGLKNYIEVFSDSRVVNSIRVTSIYAVVSTSVQFILGFAIALLLNNKLPGIGFFRLVLIIPMMLPDVVVGLMWRLILHARYGILNYLLGLVNIKPQMWLGPEWALFSITSVEIWYQTSFFILMLLAGLQAIPNELYESSRIDGASFFQEVRHITLPLLKPIILISLIFRTVFVLRSFGVTWVLTGGGPGSITELLSIKIYQEAFNFYNVGYASTISWLLLLVSVGISLLYIKLIYQKEELL